MSGDALAALYPSSAADMAVALEHVRIPGPPAPLALTEAERGDPHPAVRYRRRVIQRLGGAGDDDVLALIDKALPHAQHDLMLSEVSASAKATPLDVAPRTAQLLWRTGLSFVELTADPALRRAFGLDGGALHLAMNCDPHTRDRESIQAAKQYHLHLICWTRAELAGLARPDRLADLADPLIRRQILDPLAFLGADLVHAALVDRPLSWPGAQWLPPDPAAVIAGRRPLGGLLRLPAWTVLEDPAFAELIAEIHRRLTAWAARLLLAFTGHEGAPPPWRRHRLLAPDHILANLEALTLSPCARAGLAVLARRLRDLPPPLAERLARAAPSRREHLMTLNQPSYALSLQGPVPGLGQPAAEDAAVYLSIQPKLFSGIGGAGLLHLAGVPCVRIRRGVGAFSAAQWAQRARFQQTFARYNEARLAGATRCVFGPVRHFAGPGRGWVDAAGHAGRSKGPSR